MLSPSSTQHHRFASIAAFTALVYTETESMHAEAVSFKVRALAVAACSKPMECAATVRARTVELLEDCQQDCGLKFSPFLLSCYCLLSVSDPSTDVRYVASESLEKAALYPCLLRPEIPATFFMCFYDGSLGMNSASLSSSRRFRDLNRAHILPVIRRYLTHLFTSPDDGLGWSLNNKTISTYGHISLVEIHTYIQSTYK